MGLTLELIDMTTSKCSSCGILVYIGNGFVCNDTLVFKSHDAIICVEFGASFNVCDDLYIYLCYVVPEGSSRKEMIESHAF